MSGSFLDEAWKMFWGNKPDHLQMTAKEAKLVEAGYKCGAAAMFKFMVNLSDSGKTEDEMMTIYHMIDEEIDTMSDRGDSLLKFKGTMQ
jgi:hypothetical protein